MKHVKILVKVQFDESSKRITLPAIYICDQGILIHHLRYLKSNRTNSQSWQDKSVNSMRLLLDYASVNKNIYNNPVEMFEGFRDAVFYGTIDPLSGDDSSGLRWAGKSIQTANQHLANISDFSEWLYNETNGSSVLLNKIRKSTGHEQILLQAAYNHKKNRAFLKHTYHADKEKSAISKVRSVKKINELPYLGQEMKCFPEEKIKELLFEGFVNPGTSPTDPLHVRLNLKNVLLTMLMNFGGLRESEPFHIYVDDILQTKNGIPVVRVYHPTLGLAPDYYCREYGNTFRHEYLAKRYGLEDRKTSRKKAYHAGWKHPALDSRTGNYFIVRFYPLSMEKLFYALWRLYIKSQRVPPPKNRLHPFAFTNKNGNPASIEQYNRALERGVNKIGLTYKKCYGTTSHGGRHANGKRLSLSGVDPLITKAVMHHSSIESQIVYTEPTSEEIRKAMEQAESKNHDLIGNVPSSILDGFADVDPQGLFSGRNPKLERI